MVAEGILKKLGAKMTLACDGVEGAEAVRNARRPFNLILMDCEMPNLDGFGATGQIRALEAERNLPPTRQAATRASCT